MELSLFQATLLFGFLLLAAGGILLLQYKPAAAIARSFPRSGQAGVVLMILAMVWTAVKIMNLGSADYGEFKEYLLVGFGLLALLTFKYAPDFLSVRAAAILYLYLADTLLGGAWMQYDEPLRLFLVTPVYLGIALALYLAFAPFRLRDFFGWVFAIGSRAKKMAVGLTAYGLLLVGIAFAY